MSPLSGMKLYKANFELLDLPNLITNIWECNGEMHANCLICK